MADLTLDLSEESSILGEKTRQPLVYNSNTNTNTISNIMLIDSNVIESQIFYDSANEKTFPIIYSYDSNRDELLQLLQNKFTSIERISFVFHDSINGKTFLDNEPFFLETDFVNGNPSLSPNVTFLLKIISDFTVKNIDFLQCNSLNHENWVKYYDLLNKNTNVVVGGSSDETGNLQNGGNWIMENTNEDIQKVYFTNNISNYNSTLSTVIQNTTAGENIIISYNNPDWYYKYENDGEWNFSNGTTSFNFKNNSSQTMNVTFVKQTLNYNINNVNFFFNVGSNNITFDGCGNTFIIYYVTNYGGLFRNGTSTTNGFSGITIRNFITTTSSSTTIASDCGHLLSSYFGRNINPYDFTTNSPSLGTNVFIKVENCTNNANISSEFTGGIIGSYFCQGGYGIISNCTNTTRITKSNCGGIVGRFCADTSGNVLIQNCRNTADYAFYGGASNNGGICGPNACFGGVLDISGCKNSGDFWNDGVNETAGICANNAATSPSSILRITNCENTGSNYAYNSYGIFGRINSSDLMGTIIIDGCINRGYIDGQFNSGICGTTSNSKINKGVFTIKNCSNYGVLQLFGTSGIVAVFAGSGNTTLGSSTVDASLKPVNVINCTNYGLINAELCGGIVGYQAALNGGSINIINCSNFGNISASYCGGIVAHRATSDGPGTVILNNCFNYGNMLSTITGCGGICGSWSGCNGKIYISNCYNLGNIRGTSCGGIMGADAGYSAITNPITNFTLNQIIDISNCYSTGIITNGNNSGAILGGRIYTNNDGASGSSFTLKIKNCYTLSDPSYNANITNTAFTNLNFWDSADKINSQNLTGILPYTYISNLKTKSTVGYTYVDISNNYSTASSSGWKDASANLRLLNTPTDLYANNPTSVWAKINSTTTTPYLLSSFNSPIYDPSNVIIKNDPSYNSSRGLFTDASGNYRYSLLSVNNANPTSYSNIVTLDPSFGNLKFSDKFEQNRVYTSKVFVSKSDASGNTYSYNFNQFTFRNDYARETIRNNGFVYIKQNANNVIQYSLDNNIWTDISGGNAPAGNITISSIDPSATNILNVLFTTPIVLSVSNSCNFVVKSNYITFDGSYNNTVDGSYNKITFNNLTNYDGFIQNGTDASNGYYGVKVQNFITDISGTSTLYSNDLSGNADGWLVGSYFGKNSKTVSGFDKTRLADAISIKNITNKAHVTSNYAGGICGSNFGFNSYATIENCSNVGDISGNYAGGICGSRVASNGGEVIITKTFNSANILGEGSGGLCGTSAALPNATISSAADTSSNLIIRNSYSTGHINGINAGGICGSNTGYTTGNNYGSSKVLIENSYSLGDVTNTNGGKIIGGTNLSSTDVSFNNNIRIDISNCYGYGSDSTNNLNLHGNNFLQLSQTSLGKLTINQTKWYNALKNSWLDASASQDNGIDGPENLYNNNPGSIWTSVKENNPYVLSNFNSPIYNPNEVTFKQLTTDYKQRSGLFSYSDYSYNLITVNNADPSYNGIYIDSSGASVGALVFPNTLRYNKNYTAEVFVSKGVEPYYTNYNYNTFGFFNISYTIDASSIVYIKQDASSNILFSINKTNWTKIVGNVTVYNSKWELGEVLTILFQTDITIDPSNSSYYDSETGLTDNFNFILKSSYITFEGSNKNITFKNQTNYKGFIQNGTANSSGYYGVKVKNFNTILNNTGVFGGNNLLYSNYDICGNDTKRSVEPDSAGWLIASYFGKNSRNYFKFINPTGVFNKSKDVISVQNIKNTGIISGHYTGGICGTYFGSGDCYATIINCSNSGTISNVSNYHTGCGGICATGVGAYGGEVRILNCRNDGEIYTNYGGGICGSKVADGSGNVLISSCYSVSDIDGLNSGGICGQSVGCDRGLVTIKNCYSIGDINGYNSGGICGADSGYKLTYPVNSSFGIQNVYTLDVSGATINNSTVNIENCYSIGDISGNGGKLIGGSNMRYKNNLGIDTNIGNITVTAPSRINITKCFANDSSNNDSGYTSNNIIGNYYTTFANANNTSIIFNSKTFLVDIFNNEIN